MSIEAIAAAAAPQQLALQQPVQAGYGASLVDVGRFEGALAQAGAPAAPAVASLSPGSPDRVGPAIKGMFTSLDKVDSEAASVSKFASAAQNAGREMKPGEVIQLTMRCYEFMFHCQLTSNIANRSSDGLQQLFKQQS